MKLNFILNRKMNNFICFGTILIILGTCRANFDTINKNLVNKKIERKLDVASQLVKLSNKITLENNGAGAVKSFLFSLPKTDAEKLSYIGAQTSGSTLKISETSVQEQHEFAFYRVDLRDSLQSGKTVTVEVDVVLIGALVPYPSSIQQGEKQLVEYTGNHYVLSPYLTTTQTTVVTLVSPNVMSYSRLKPASHTDTSITYGPYDNVQAFSQDVMKVHYENNSPFLKISHLERVVEVSHWGNIAVEETVDVVHAGALLKGSFSRYDYQREHNGYSSVKAIKTILPAAAKDVYYRDEIGNISTSHMRVQSDAVELELRPRFPLFGGWKTHYKIGYNVPSYEYLYKTGDNYGLKMRFLDHVFDDMIVEELVVKIILPEGTRNIQLSTPYDISRHTDGIHLTYLDTVGRPVIIASKNNLVENHIQDFELSYEFPSILMLQEPLLIVVAFFLLFILVIFYVRLDLTINKDDAVEAKMRVSSHCELVHTHHDKRATLYETIEEEILKLKTSKDVTQSQTVTKKLIGSLREETQSVNDLMAKIRIDNSEFADKVSDLQKQDKLLCECVIQQVTNAEKLVSGKMNKQQYMDADSTLNKKKEASLEKIRNIANTI